MRKIIKKMESQCLIDDLVVLQPAEIKIIMDSICHLRRRIKEMQDELQSKTDGDIPGDWIGPIKEELNTKRIENREYIEISKHYILPPRHAPGMLLESYAFLEKKGVENRLKRIYVSPKMGYVAVMVEDMWERKGIDAREFQKNHDEKNEEILLNGMNGWEE